MSSTHHTPNSTMPIDVVIMAAGKGTRMKSALPKVLHRIGGRALLQHVLDTAASLQARKVVVVTGHGSAQVEDSCKANAKAGFALDFARQEPQLGTGHAVQQALPHLGDDGVVVVLSGDVPLTQADTLFHLISASGGTKLALLTLEMPDATGYGRIERAANGDVQAIVEHKDATPEQRQIQEVYSGIMALPAASLKRWLARLDNQNAQKEFYLTDIVRFAVADGEQVVAYKISDAVQGGLGRLGEQVVERVPVAAKVAGQIEAHRELLHQRVPASGGPQGDGSQAGLCPGGGHHRIGGCGLEAGWFLGQGTVQGHGRILWKLA